MKYFYLIFVFSFTTCKQDSGKPTVISEQERLILEHLITTGRTRSNDYFIESHKQDYLEMKKDVLYLIGEDITIDSPRLLQTIEQSMPEELHSSAKNLIEKSLHQLFQVAGNDQKLNKNECLSFHKYTETQRKERDTKLTERQAKEKNNLELCIKKDTKGDEIFEQHSKCLEKANTESPLDLPTAQKTSPAETLEFDNACQELFSKAVLTRLGADMAGVISEKDLSPWTDSLLMHATENKAIAQRIYFFTDLKRKLNQFLSKYAESYNACLDDIEQKDVIKACLKSTHTVLKETP